MSEADLRNAIVQLSNLIAKQQQQIENLENRGDPVAVGSEKTIESLASGIQDFQYDPDAGVFFDGWYARYEDVFMQDGKSLDTLHTQIGSPVDQVSTSDMSTKHLNCFPLGVPGECTRIPAWFTSPDSNTMSILQSVRWSPSALSSYSLEVMQLQQELHC